MIDFDTLDIPDKDRKQLTEVDGDSWSGMTIKEGDATAIILNPSNARTRQCSTLMHELAHVILKHVPARVDVSPTGLLLLSDFSDDQEAEADWLASALLLPRPGLIRLRSLGQTTKEIATHYCVSETFCEWRLRMTGVDVQMRRRQKA